MATSLQHLLLQNHQITKNVKYNSDKPWFAPEIMGLIKKEDFQSKNKNKTVYTKAKYNLYKKVWPQKVNTGN